MEKGDIVRLKIGQSLRGSELLMYLSPGSKLQEFYTVKEDPRYRRVGCADEVELVVQFEETSASDSFYASHFDVVLKAGEPDVKKLMEESVMATV